METSVTLICDFKFSENFDHIQGDEESLCMIVVFWSFSISPLPLMTSRTNLTVCRPAHVITISASLTTPSGRNLARNWNLWFRVLRICLSNHIDEILSFNILHIYTPLFPSHRRVEFLVLECSALAHRPDELDINISTIVPIAQRYVYNNTYQPRSNVCVYGMPVISLSERESNCISLLTAAHFKVCLRVAYVAESRIKILRRNFRAVH